MNTIRTQIIRQFCKSIAWIDDEIIGASACKDQLPAEALLSKHFSYFSKEAELLYQAGMLCSLIPFESGDSLTETEQQITRCADLCTAADVIILDWQMGSHQDFSCCLKIIKKILLLQGIRFIIILSNFASGITEDLQSEFDMLHYRNSSVWLTDDKGKYITIAEKSDNNLTDILSEKLLCFSDSLLAWVAIEISNIIRKTIPTLIKSIPNDADAGFLLDYFLSGKDSFTSDTIISNMLEDINYTVKYSVLTSLSSREINDENSSARKLMINAFEEFATISETADLKQSSIANLVQQLISNSDTVSFADYVNVIKDDLLKAYNYCKPNPHGTDNLSALIQSIVSFTSYCETLCIKPDDNLMQKLCRGNIYQSSDYSSSLFLCISQACDAEHKKQIYFLKADKTPTSLLRNANRIFITINCSLYSIPLSPASLVILDKSLLTNQDSHFSLIGHLRSDTIENISNRFWSHITRVGINLPCIDRALRK